MGKLQDVIRLMPHRFPRGLVGFPDRPANFPPTVSSLMTICGGLPTVVGNRDGLIPSVPRRRTPPMSNGGRSGRRRAAGQSVKALRLDSPAGWEQFSIQLKGLGQNAQVLRYRESSPSAPGFSKNPLRNSFGRNGTQLISSYHLCVICYRR